MALLVPALGAQNQATDAKAVHLQTVAEVYQTLYLTNLTQPNDLNDIQTSMRNVLPKLRIYGNASQNAISLYGTPEDIQVAQKILADLDRARNLYRLTYTITESDSGKRLGIQHFSFLAASGQKTDLKQGSRVPLVTGTYDTASATANNQVQYVDVGLSIQATADTAGHGVRLNTKIEQSSVAEEKSGLGTQDPVIRQTSLLQVVNLVLAKPLVLGSIDIPGTTRHEDIEVVAELVP